MDQIQVTDPWLILFINAVQNEPIHGPLPPHSVSFVWDVVLVFEVHMLNEHSASVSDPIANTTMAIINLFALAAVRNIEGRDCVLAYNQFLALASIIEHYNSKTLAAVTSSLVSHLPTPLGEMLRLEIMKNMIFFFGAGPKISDIPKERSSRIKDWVCLNHFAAYLAKYEVLPFMEFASQILDFAFGDTLPGDWSEGQEYHIPAAAAWFSIMGREIRSLVVTRDDDDRDFSMPKWAHWKQTFRSIQWSSDMSYDLGNTAEEAWYDMDVLEMEIPGPAQAGQMDTT